MVDGTHGVNKSQHIFSRREFLMLFGVATGGAFLGAKLKLNFDKVINLEGGKNELYRPVVDQIRDAVEKNEQEGIKVTYSKNPEFQSLTELTPVSTRILQNEIIATIKTREISGGRFKYNSIELAKGRLPDNVVLMLIGTSSVFDNFESLQLIEGSGFSKRANVEQDIQDLDSFMKSQADNGGFYHPLGTDLT